MESEIVIERILCDRMWPLRADLRKIGSQDADWRASRGQVHPSQRGFLPTDCRLSYPVGDMAQNWSIWEGGGPRYGLCVGQKAGIGRKNKRLPFSSRVIRRSPSASFGDSQCDGSGCHRSRRRAKKIGW